MLHVSIPNYLFIIFLLCWLNESLDRISSFLILISLPTFDSGLGKMLVSEILVSFIYSIKFISDASEDIVFRMCLTLL